MRELGAFLATIAIVALIFMATFVIVDAVSDIKYVNYKERLLFKCKSGEVKSCKELETSVTNNCIQWSDKWDCDYLSRARKHQNLDYIKYGKTSCLKGYTPACEDLMDLIKNN